MCVLQNATLTPTDSLQLCTCWLLKEKPNSLSLSLSGVEQGTHRPVQWRLVLPNTAEECDYLGMRDLHTARNTLNPLKNTMQWQLYRLGWWWWWWTGYVAPEST